MSAVPAPAENTPQNLEPSGGASEALTYTLSQCIARGLEVNPRIQAVESELLKAESDIADQRGGFFPVLSAQSYVEDIANIREHGPSDEDYVDQRIDVMNFRLSQTLFAGMTVFNAYQKAQLNKALVEAGKKREEMRLVLDIQLLFFELLKARQDVTSLHDAVQRLEVDLEAAKAFYGQKLAPYVQVLQAQVELADARQQLSQAENKVETSRAQLNILLGFSGPQPIVYTGELKQGPEFTAPMEECLDYAYTYRPEMQIAEKSIQMAKQDQKIALGRFSPRLTASIDYYSRDDNYDNKGINPLGQPYDIDQENTYWITSLRMDWEFGLGGQQYHRYRKAIHEIHRLEQNRQALKDQINAEVITYFMNLKEADQRIDTTDTARQAAQEGYEMAQKRFEVSMGSIPEVLDAQAQLSRAEANYNQAVGDYLMSLAKLNHAMGWSDYTLDQESPTAEQQEQECANF